MRGEVCVGFASILSFASMLLLIFVHVGQINTSTIPRKISMAKVNTSGYAASLELFIQNNITGLYTTNGSAPLQAQAGLRPYYEFGLYSYCAFVDPEKKSGICANKTAGSQFKPYDAMTGDMQQNYSILSNNFLPETTFRDSKYTGESTKAAYWMLLLGTVCAALALLTGIAKNNLTFFVSAIFAVAGSILLLIGASLWTVVIKKSQAINDLLILIEQTGTQAKVGIIVSEGTGLYLTWAAFACLLVSVIPYLISCCTYRG